MPDRESAQLTAVAWHFTETVHGSHCPNKNTQVLATSKKSHFRVQNMWEQITDRSHFPLAVYFPQFQSLK